MDITQFCITYVTDTDPNFFRDMNNSVVDKENIYHWFAVSVAMEIMGIKPNGYAHPEVIKKFFKEVNKTFQSQKKREERDTAVRDKVYKTLNGLLPVINLEEDDQVVMLNPDTKLQSVQKFKALVKSVGVKSDEILPYVRKGIFRFCPFGLPDTKELDSGETVDLFNSYISPKWRLNKRRPGPIPNPDKLFTQFMKHLFPINEEREYIYDWIACMLKYRNEVALVCVGVRGNGKGTFQEILCSLVGAGNAERLPKNFLETHFNDQMARGQLKILDDTPIRSPAADNGANSYDNFKRLQNFKITVEGKGRDPIPNIENYNSFLVCANSLKSVYVEYDERKMFIPTMGDQMLEDIWTTEKIIAFREEITNPDSELISDLGHYFLNRKIDENKMLQKPPLTEKFWDCVATHLGADKRHVLNKAMRGDIRVRMGREDLLLPGSKMGSQTMVDFLTDFKWKGQKLVNKVESREDNFEVMETNLFWRPAEKEALENGFEELL